MGLDVDDLFENNNKPRKVNGCKKGKRFEREIVKKLIIRFGTGFSRSLGSGNRWGQVANLPEHAKQTLTGDICCPEGFAWVFECKGGYSEIDVHSFFKGSKKFDEFLQQASDDGNRLSKKPVVIWKKDRKEILAAFKSTDVIKEYTYAFKYREWTIITLDKFLEMDDSVFIQNQTT